MERITYRITLDAHKTGIQRRLQGVETADNMSRRISIGLTAGSDTYEIPPDVFAMMYIRTPDSTEPSINECVIEENTIIYDMLPITVEGTTEMQLKLIGTSPEGAKRVLISPKFTVDVMASNTDDEGAEQTTTFTALEEAVAMAKGVYDERLLRVELDKDCTFRAYFADGTVYENESLKDLVYNGNAVLSESYAKGGTGTREGEDEDNAMYYSNISKSVFESCKAVNEDCYNVNADCHEVFDNIVDEIAEKTVYTTFSVDFETGHLTYLSQAYSFTIDENGRLQFEGQGEWIPTDATQQALNNLVADLTATINTLESRVKALEEA